MALSDSGILELKNSMKKISAESDKLGTELSTIKGFLNNSDLDVWSSDTEIGKKWVENLTDMLNHLNNLCTEDFDHLRRSTNAFIEKQEQLNRGVM